MENMERQEAGIPLHSVSRSVMSHVSRDRPFACDEAICARIVPKDVASVDLSDSVDLGISKLRVSRTWVRFDPPSRHQI
jgi:hypothetical protein